MKIVAYRYRICVPQTPKMKKLFNNQTHTQWFYSEHKREPAINVEEQILYVETDAKNDQHRS